MTEDPARIAELICTALCSEPEILAAMNKHLSAVMRDIEDPETGCDAVWSYESQTAICAFIEASAIMVSEYVNGNIRREPPK